MPGVLGEQRGDPCGWSRVSERSHSHEAWSRIGEMRGLGPMDLDGV